MEIFSDFLNLFRFDAVGKISAVSLMPALQPAVIAHSDKSVNKLYIHDTHLGFTSLISKLSLMIFLASASEPISFSVIICTSRFPSAVPSVGPA